MRYLIALLLLLLPASAMAQSYPALYNVTGVAANDTLNVRAEPRAGAEKIGELAASATDIEVIRDQNGWGLVNIGERSGWTSLRYLRRQVTGDYALTRRLSCYGTEPFWSLEIEQGNMTILSRPRGDTFSLAGLLQVSSNRTDRFSLGAASLLAVIARATCSDGMSDKDFGLTIDFWPDAANSMDFYSGCCSLTGN